MIRKNVNSKKRKKTGSYFLFHASAAVWTEWVEAGTCSTTCGPGTINRTRTCTPPPTPEGLDCDSIPGDENGDKLTGLGACEIERCRGELGKVKLQNS